ncbi:MAG: diguanylate cyclase [Nautiliaceae bacterium]
MRFLFLFLAVILYADINVYTDENFSVSLPKPFVKKRLGFYHKNGFLIVNYRDLPFIAGKNFVVVCGIGNLNTYIFSNTPLEKISKIANSDIVTDIFFYTSDKKIKKIKASLEDFKNKRVPAIVLHKKLDIPNIYYYDLSKLGLKFNKYYLVAYKKFYDSHKNSAKFLSVYFDKNNNINISVLLLSLYLRKKILLSDSYKKKMENLITKKLKVVLTSCWPPFTMLNGAKLEGIGVDFWKLIAKKANLDYEFIIEPVWIKILEGIKNGEYDITIATSKTKDREKYAVFSIPYVEFPFAIACRNDLKFSSIKDIKQIAVGYNYTAHKLMKKYYPSKTYIPAKNLKEAFNLILNKKAECVVDILPSVLWMINKNHLGEVRIVFKTPFTFKLQVMIKKDLKDLKLKIDKAIRSISENERNRIVAKYIGEGYIRKQRNFYIYFLVLLVAILIFFIYKTFFYKKKSEIDLLTKTLNRGTIEERLKYILNSSYGSLLFLDIDKFKSINDTYGHEEGDEVLRNFVKLIKKEIRSSDILGRWGGEEFVVVLPFTYYGNAFLVAEKIRRSVEEFDFKGKKVTVSIGVTEFKKGEKLEDVIARADEAVYEAKNSGRNQVKGKL